MILPDGLQPSVATATPMRKLKEWHRSLPPSLRLHLVRKLVQAILPTTDPNEMWNRRLRRLVLYARNIEDDLYERANSRSEYYHLLAKKIYEFEKKLERKRRQNERQLLQQQSTDPHSVQQPSN